jgi:hypothetical protein
MKCPVASPAKTLSFHIRTILNYLPFSTALHALHRRTRHNCSAARSGCVARITADGSLFSCISKYCCPSLFQQYPPLHPSLKGFYLLWPLQMAPVSVTECLLFTPHTLLPLLLHPTLPFYHSPGLFLTSFPLRSF